MSIPEATRAGKATGAVKSWLSKVPKSLALGDGGAASAKVEGLAAFSVTDSVKSAAGVFDRFVVDLRAGGVADWPKDACG